MPIQLSIPFAALNLFAVALSKALRVKQFNKHTFVDRVKANPGLMTKQSSADGYLELIERVYNHASGKKNRLPVAFLAKEAARERCAVNIGNAKNK